MKRPSILDRALPLLREGKIDTARASPLGNLGVAYDGLTQYEKAIGTTSRHWSLLEK